MPNKKLSISNARANNLRNVSLELPHDSLTVITGLSGSGKSSLAFDTVYAEGQRRYIETFSPYTRQFFDKVKKPDVDLIENVRPAIAIQQRTRVTGSRSTVGTMTNINELLKIIWANVAKPVCPVCGIHLKAWDAEKLVSHLSGLLRVKPDATFLVAGFVAMPRKKSLMLQEVQQLQEAGFSRYFHMGRRDLSLLEEFDEHGLSPDGDLYVVLDRVRSEAIDEKRLKEAIDQAFSLSKGGCCFLEPGECKAKPGIRVLNTPEQQNVTPLPVKASFFYNTYRCEGGPLRIAKPRPALFSYNSPVGACTECKGFGNILSIDPALCIPDESLSIEEKAVQCWSGEAARGEHKRLLKFCAKHDIATDVPWKLLSEEQKNSIFTHRSRDFHGILPWFAMIERKKYKLHVRVFLSRYRSQVLCPSCNGSRLRSDALAYRIKGRTISEIFELPVKDLLRWLQILHSELQGEASLPRQLRDVFQATISQLEYLDDLGLPYLALSRPARTLSGGETQRVNLATALGSDLISTHFVLDEPSVGLHPRDTERLIKSILKLTRRGNSVLVVEHDPDCILSADTIVELGPGAGEQGGEIVFNGPREKWDASRIAFTDLDRIRSRFRAIKQPRAALEIRNASSRNISNLNVDVPLNQFVCLTGVSGSGKSTLVTEILLRAWNEYRSGNEIQTEAHVKGFNHIEQLLLVDQSPLAKSPRANIATYSGIWDSIRTMFSQTDDAIARALSKSAFSFNVSAGRCPACNGAGFVREDMQFLSDVYIPCEVCLGKRFQPTVLEVKLKGKSVDEVLGMTIDAASVFFHSEESVRGPLEILSLLGLGHVTLGHPLSELSGGEAQRLKLVPFIDRSSTGRSLLVFDEPTTGLHTRDIERLLDLFAELKRRGHSILCIEHNMSLIACADWLLDLGPEGGNAGGHLVMEGTPEDFIDSPGSSYTASFLHAFTKYGDGRNGSGSRTREVPLAEESSVERNLLIRGAREHNLKNVDVRIPLDRVVALVGVSGSGKSSIAKDIIYSEGQRRYLDCLSPYARQYINELRKPDIDSIVNLKPTICVYQHTFQPGRLSTVGTMSEVYNFLRLLFAKTGEQRCPEHPDQQISSFSPELLTESVLSIADSSTRILAPIVKLKKGNHREVFERAVNSEIGEVRVDGLFVRPGEFHYDLERNKAHSIDYVVARFNSSRVDRDMVLDAVKQALALGGGNIIVHTKSHEELMSAERTCPACGRGFFKPDPEDLSFHSRRGACPKCHGTGTGARGKTCKACNGTRINLIGSNLRIGDRNIHELACMTPPALARFLHDLEFSSRTERIAHSILAELYGKLDTLCKVGLDYVDLDRDCTTLSGGELQRLRLAAATGSPLSGVLFIFDEPSAGLHPDDNEKVLENIRHLKDAGNSVIVIEHDAQSILASDHVLEIGPGGGTQGGEIVFEGTVEDFAESRESKTAEALRVERPVERVEIADNRPQLSIVNASLHNLKGLSVDIPLRSLVAIAGVSGAGKSSLVHGIIAEAFVEGAGAKAQDWELHGAKMKSSIPVQRMLLIDQKPIGLNSRSTPASYLGIWDHIRTVFASTIEARTRGLKAGHFSYNTGKGRCPECRGLGVQTLEMSFLPDASVVCETCNGTRYTDDTLGIKFRDMSVHDVLSMSFEEARFIFSHHRKIHHVLHNACELGLGYLTLGQSSSTLSGGESQRIKLVSELSGSQKGHNLYLFDEPTTGLHKSDIARLIKTMRSLIDHDNSVIIIEHEEDIIRSADWVIELGPGPGERGGEIIFEGTPFDLSKSKTPWGRLLRESVMDRFRKTREGKFSCSRPRA